MFIHDICICISFGGEETLNPKAGKLDFGSALVEDQCFGFRAQRLWVLRTPGFLKGLGLTVQGLGFRVQGLGFRVELLPYLKAQGTW